MAQEELLTFAQVARRLGSHHRQLVRLLAHHPELPVQGHGRLRLVRESDLPAFALALNPPHLMTVNQAAQRLGVVPATVRALIHQGRLRSHRTLFGVRLEREQVEERAQGKLR